MTLLHSRPFESPPSLRVLVVDDDAAVRDVLCEILTVCGHVAVSVAGGHDAVGRLSREVFDLVLVDLWMPDFSGQEVYAWIREHHPEQAERVVFVTGDHVSEPIHSFIESSGRPCLHKPFEVAEVEHLAGLARV